VSQARVRFLLPDGAHVELGPGALIGRMAGAQLCLDDERVSEAHALVSLRGGELKLLALRGRFAVKGKPRTDLVLREGVSVYLAKDLKLQVVSVELPDVVLALQGADLPRQVLSGVCSLRTRPRPQLVLRYDGNAQGWLWNTGERWRLRTPDGTLTPLQEGAQFTLDGHTFELVAVELDRAGHNRTQLTGAVHSPLQLVANYDTVHIHRHGQVPVALTGIPARVVSELVACGAPVAWDAVARQIWSKVGDDHALRRKWDVNLARLRSKLRAGGVRTNLVRADGTGNIELLLEPGDAVVDNT
jgi:hypothetical protein